jgi:hypothetical protein
VTEKLTKEGDHAFREPAREEGRKGLAYERRTQAIWFKLQNVRRVAYSVAADEDEKGSDEARTRQSISGELEPEDRRDFGLISEDGTELLRDERLNLDINQADEDGGTVWFHEKDEEEYRLKRGFYFSAYVSRERLQWFWNELQTRPEGELRVRIDVPAYQYEVDAFLAEPWIRQEFYFAKGQATEIAGISIYVNDPQPPETKSAEPESDDEPLAGVLRKKPAPGEASPKSPEAILLRRLVRGVGWLVALQVLALLAMCSLAGEYGM